MQSLRVPKRTFRSRHRDALVALALSGPFLLWWAVLSAGPLTFGFALGFFEWIGLGQTPHFVGLQNFMRFFKDPMYYMSLVRSLWIGGLGSGMCILIGLGVALLLNQPIKGRDFYRTIWYVPVVTSVIAVLQVFNILLDPTNGVVNNLLHNLFGMRKIFWGMNVFWGVFWITVYSVWKNLGTMTLMWLAGLQSIDPVMYEAAKIDGANRSQMFRYITVPGLKSMTLFILINGCLNAVQIYEPVMFITNGGPYGSTEVLVFRILRDAFWDFNFGMAGASSFVLAFVVTVFAFFIFRSQKESLKEKVK